MSVFSALTSGNKVSGFEEAFGVKDITSNYMKTAIREWFSLYFDSEPVADEDSGQRLPVLIINKLCKTVFSEYTASVSGRKAAFMEPLLRRLDAIKKKAMQFELVGGECFIKPVLYGNSFDFLVVRRDHVIPLARDARGKMTSVGSSELTVFGGKYYTLLERRTVNEKGDLTIESCLYMSDRKDSIGTQVSLEALDKYAAMQPVIVLPAVYNLGMVQMGTPLLNCVDGSDDAVSIYAPAVKLIRNINRNEQQLDDEFDNGASRIIASADMVVTDKNGKKKLSDKLFVAVDDDPETVGVTVYSPTLRESSYLARKQEYLRNIESQIGLKRGILSEVEAAERTATEITSSQGDYNLTIQAFQATWESAVRELLATCDRLGQIYQFCGSEPFDPEKDLVIDWGDGVLYNRDKTWVEYKEMVASGMLKPELALAWYFNLPHKTSAELQKIREEYMPEMEALIGGE